MSHLSTTNETPATIPAAFLATVEAHPGDPALRWRQGEELAEWTWREYADQVERAVTGLQRLGLQRGERLVLLLPNMPEFHVVDTATLFVGGTPISIYNSSSPEQIAYVVGHCKATVVVVHASMLERVLEVRDRLDNVRDVVVVGGDAPEKTTAYDVLVGAEPADLAALAPQVRPGDLATVIYTSGTTGAPKGVMITHDNIRSEFEAGRGFWPEDMQLSVISYLPMAHVAERMVTHYLHIVLGSAVTTCPEMTQLGAYLGQVRPHILFGPPRVWEKLYAGLNAAVAAAPPERREAFARGLAVGRKVQEAKARGEELPPELAAAWEQVDAEFSGIRALVGLDRLVIGFSGAAPIPPEIIVFFRDLGVPMSEIYGMSENTGGMTWDPFAVRPGTVGRAMKGVELRIAEDGELLCRGPVVFQGYLDDPQRTAEALDEDGWLHTGDIAEIDDDGYVRIVDRKKELIITAGGKNVSPANIEAALKTIPVVGQAMVVGDNQPYLVALLVLDPEIAPGWAAAQGIEGSLADLADHPAVQQHVADAVREVNGRFSQVEHVRRFALLGEEWLPDSDFLTPTMKLKRRGVLDRYRSVVEDMYADGGVLVEGAAHPVETPAGA